MIIFDSNVWVALFNEKDSQHKKAKDLLVATKESAKELVALPEHIIAETASVLVAKSGRETAELFLAAAMDNAAATILLSRPELFWRTLSLFRESEYIRKTKLSFIDTMLVALSTDWGHTVVTFDRELERVIKKSALAHRRT